jgi:hypothetical protein
MKVETTPAPPLAQRRRDPSRGGENSRLGSGTRSNDASTLLRIERVIKEKAAKTLGIGDYRLGPYLVEGPVHIAHVANRRDIYRVFP